MLRRWPLIVLFLAFGEAVAASEPHDESRRWVPSFAVFFDMLGQKAEGTVTTGPVLGAPLSPNDAEQDAFADGNGCLRRAGPSGGPFVYSRDGALCASGRPNRTKLLPDTEGSDTSIVPLVGASLELMTPSLLGDVWSHPRLFAHGDVSAAFSYERNLAGEEGPGPFRLPKEIRTDGGALEDINVEEVSIGGQGSRTRMQVRRWVYSGGAGLAFGFDLLDRRFRVKPSFEYFREEMDFIGVANRAVKLKIPSGAADLSGFRLISLTQTERKSYEGIGPGLEIEVDAARLGPFVSSVFLMGRGYTLLGDLGVSMTKTNEVGETATWTAKLDRWAWRSGVGFRFRWVPEAD
jgi:hypothetical protein